MATNELGLKLSQLRTLFWTVLAFSVLMLAVTWHIASKHQTTHGLKIKRGTGRPDWSNEAPVNITWVDGKGTLVARIREYNEKIRQVRKKILVMRNDSSWRGIKKSVSALYGTQPDFLHQVGLVPTVTIIGLRWLKGESTSNLRGTVRADPKNLIVNSYYDWVVDRDLCEFLKTSGQSYILWSFWDKCTSKKDATFFPKPIDGKFANIRWWTLSRVAKNRIPPSLYLSEPEYITYIIIAQDAIISEEGSVTTSDVQIIPHTCRVGVTSHDPTVLKMSSMFEEVFVISQKWFFKYYHKNIEMYPRLAPYMEFLTRNPRIRIHAGSARDHDRYLMQIFQFPHYRMVRGNIRAKIAYLPEVTYCGFANPASTQLLSKMYRDQIKSRRGYLRKDTIIMIRRTKIRGFSLQDVLESSMQKLAERTGLKLVIFSDDPVPSLSQTMIVFNKAVMVVGPHGAGFSNIMFSEPGIYVIEGLCNTPGINMCYERLAYVLGHHYYGMKGISGCPKEINIDIAAFIELVEFYSSYALKFAKLINAKNEGQAVADLKIINA